MFVMIVLSGGGGGYNTIMHYATPHINLRGVLHMPVNFMFLFLSPGVTVVCIYMTIPMEGCLVFVRHSLQKIVIVKMRI
jgi:hypothetical protein